MRKQVEMRLTKSAGAENGQDETEFPDRFPAFAVAGPILGMSGPALRKKFERGDLPRKFLLRVGPRTVRVDISGLVHYLKVQASQLSA